MKRIFATVLIMLSVSLSFAQKQDANSAEHQFYCEVKCYEKGVKSNGKVILEFGKVVSKDVWNYPNRKVKFVDENGKVIKFKSMVDAANFLSERGWTLGQAYSSSYVGKKTVKHWIFSKEADNYDAMKEGLVTQKEYRSMRREERALQRQAAKSKEQQE